MNTFEDILKHVEEVSKQIYRSGKLWCYDTALHIGFHKKVEPEEVYLHAGTKKGAWQLVRSGRMDRKLLWGKKSVPFLDFPYEF